MYEIEDKDQDRYEQTVSRGQRKKDWIKNFAIVFLLIMLVLTFFSNTIMNYSLPQVATQYVQEGEISPRVTGSGTAEVEDPYSVTVPNGRTISSVNVHVGDTVNKDDVIYELEDSESDDLKTARQEYTEASNNFEKSLYSGDLTNEALARIKEGNYLTGDQMQERLDAANTAYNNAVEENTEASLAVDRLTNTTSEASSSSSTAAAAAADAASKRLAEAQSRKAETEAALTKATNDRDTTVKSIQAELELKALQETRDTAKEKVEALEKAETGTEVKSPVAGTITSLTYNAGDTTSSDSPGAVIQVEGKGMTVSFTCTKAQAQTLKVGQEASPQNAWAYTEAFSAKLLSVKTDSSDPNNSRVLTFEIISSEVQAGDTVQLSVGTGSTSYDLTVPNSAIREDNNGNFILIVSSRQSPLGNRYIATRVDVQILASDSTTTAVSGNLSGYEYVITTSTRPVSAGQQVRLAEDTDSSDSSEGN